MPRALQVIHQYGEPNKARMLNGDIVERKEKIFYDGRLLPVLHYDNHFVYHTGKRVIGSVLMCTCGGPAGVFGYQAYEKYCSYMGNEVIGCINHLNYGVHSDGST